MGYAFVTSVERGQWHLVYVRKLRNNLVRIFLCSHRYAARQRGFSTSDVCSGASEADEAKKILESGRVPAPTVADLPKLL